MKRPAVHAPQVAAGYCLPACARMALSQFGLDVPLAQLAERLGTRHGVGTPFSRIRLLENNELSVTVLEQAALGDLAAALEAEAAVIVFLLTVPEMPGWSDEKQAAHTILATEVSAAHVTYHDPFLAAGPAQMPTEAFLIGWEEMNNACAIISRRE